jgi:hypothetical protein
VNVTFAPGAAAKRQSAVSGVTAKRFVIFNRDSLLVKSILQIDTGIQSSGFKCKI